ncbi:MAG TPA: hypothetical protein VK081_01580, partial [Planctomycetota bacterium]|nr:hypothetical protein [Planctomycetota bacterium]
MRNVLPIASLAVLASLSTAQQIIVPAGQNFANTGSSTAVFRTTAFRFQMQYDDTLFTAAGVTAPITITRLRFKVTDGTPHAGGQVYTDITVRLAHNTLDFSAMSTTFATNLAVPDGGTVVFGPADLTVGSSSGAVPNDWAFDIPLTTPFSYDPTLGDLVVEVDAPTAPSPANTPSVGTSHLPAHKGRRLSGSSGAATGTLSDFAAVCLIDFTGPGGYGDLTGARVRFYGAACNSTASSFYEAFNFGDVMDLSNSGLTLTPAGPDNYTVTSGAAPIQTPSAAASLLTTGDDTTVPTTLPFTLNFPGGNTTVISPSANGYIWLDSSTAGDFSPSVSEFLNLTPRLAPFWHDFHAGRNVATHPAAGLYFEYDATTNPADPVALVTWQDVGVFRSGAASPTAGHSVNNFQVAIHENSGVIEFRYGAVPAGLGGIGIVGFSRGNMATDPMSRDLSTELPFTTTGPDSATVPLVLDVDVAPALGATITLTTSNIPA